MLVHLETDPSTWSTVISTSHEVVPLQDAVKDTTVYSN